MVKPIQTVEKIRDICDFCEIKKSKYNLGRGYWFCCEKCYEDVKINKTYHLSDFWCVEIFEPVDVRK